MPYTDVHRSYLQNMMAHKMLSEKDALKKYEQVRDSLYDDDTDKPKLTLEDLKVLVNEINQRISRYNLEIRVGTCELSAKRIYILVNTVATFINLALKKYTENELEVFKKIIDEVVVSESGKVSSIACMNVSVPNMNKTAIENTIEKLLADKWLEVVLGKYNLGVRTVTELGPLLKSLYTDDIDSCELCKEIIFQGYHCGECETVIHMHCLGKYTNRMRKDDSLPKCPNPGCDALVTASPITDNDETSHENDSESEEEPRRMPKPKTSRSRSRT